MDTNVYYDYDPDDPRAPVRGRELSEQATVEGLIEKFAAKIRPIDKPKPLRIFVIGDDKNATAALTQQVHLFSLEKGADIEIVGALSEKKARGIEKLSAGFHSKSVLDVLEDILQDIRMEAIGEPRCDQRLQVKPPLVHIPLKTQQQKPNTRPLCSQRQHFAQIRPPRRGGRR